MKVITIAANDAGVGFLIMVDGLTLYHAGHHAGRAGGERQGYLDEVDYLAGLVDEVDVAFMNVTGCRAHDPGALREGTYYTMGKLSPRAVIPAHEGGREFVHSDVLEQAARDGITAPYACPRCRGDRFIYSGGRIRLDLRQASS